MCWTEIVSEGYNDVSDLYSPWSLVSAVRSTAITALTALDVELDTGWDG